MRIQNLFINVFSSKTSGSDYGFIEVNGVFKGKIFNGSNVIISNSGILYGEIKAKNIEIAGAVYGNIEAQNLRIYSSGQLHYEKLNCQHVSIHDGGVLINTGEKEDETLDNITNTLDLVNDINTANIPAKMIPVSDEMKYKHDEAKVISHNTNHSLVLDTANHKSNNQKLQQIQDDTSEFQTKKQNPINSPKQLHFHTSF